MPSPLYRQLSNYFYIFRFYMHQFYHIRQIISIVNRVSGTFKKLYSYVTNKNRVGSQNRGSKNAPEKESKGTKMKYEIVGIEHAVGDFTPTTGKNANTVQHYDVYRLHTLKNSKDAYGQITAVVRATPDQMGQIIADLGGNIADVPGHILDMEVRNSFGKINLTDYEVVE